jgi:NAD(P)H-quinone oxidoreductase subunit 2
LAVVATSLAGILSNPLFTIANRAVTQTPMLQSPAAQVAIAPVSLEVQN